jgi:hypothetical protein
MFVSAKKIFEPKAQLIPGIVRRSEKKIFGLPGTT